MNVLGLGAGLRPRSGRGVVVNWYDGGDGAALLLLNGWTASGAVWPERLLTPLERTHRVLRIDNRGTGWSRGAPAPFTIGDLADDAALVLDAAEVEDAVVVGFSMGGMIAQELALRHPDRVARLVLAGSRPPAPEALNGEPRALAATLASPGDEPLEPFFRRMWAGFAAPGFADANPELLDEIARQTAERPTPRGALVHQLRAVTGWHGARRLRRIAAPTVVVHGDVDPLSPVRNGMRLAQLIPGARYVEAQGVGHLVPQEATATLLDVIEAD